jgi:hypothetical protein
MNGRNTFTYRQKLVIAAAVLMAACAAFAWWQNLTPRTGGNISTAKTGWLFLAIVHFIAVPAWLWRDDSLPAAVRRVWGWFWAGYLLRGAVELPLLIFTREWRPWHGISHNAVMLLLLVMQGRLSAGERRCTHGFVFLAAAALVFESVNAWLFGRTGSAEQGIYFAGDESMFTFINTLTWAEIAVLLPALAWWLHRYARPAA